MSTKVSIETVPKALFLASAFLLAWLFVLAIWVRWDALPQVEEMLPASSEAFWVFNLEDFEKSELKLPEEFSTFMGEPIAQLDWASAAGGAWVDGRDLQFAEVKSVSAAKAFIEREEAVEGCYTETLPYCYSWIGSMIFVAKEKDILTMVEETVLGKTANIESTQKFQNVRGRLAHWNSGFYYVDVQAATRRFMDDFGAEAAVLQLFPSTGGVFKLQALEGRNVLLAENFLAVDKSLLKGEAFYHPSERYSQDLLAWSTEGQSFEWGGQNGAAQWQRMGEILKQVSPSSGLIFEAETTAFLSQWFGEDFHFETELAPLLDQEQYFAFTPNESFLFITELEADEVKQASALKDKLAEHLKAEVQQLKGETVAYELKIDDREKLTLYFLNNAVIVSNDSELALSTLDKALGREEPRSLQDWEGLLPGSDEVLILHCPLLQDGSILKILSTRKLFDDGVFTRTHFSAKSHD